MSTPNVPYFQQAPFAGQLNQLAYPLSDAGASFTLQKGYMVWASPFPPGYSQPAYIQYLYNPSTVSSDYNTADASAQASLNFPNPNDTAQLAIPLSQTAQWTLMFDRTFELWNSYGPAGLPSGNSGSTDPSVIGVQADVMAFMQFTGMFADYSYGTATATGAPPAGTLQSANLSLSSGIMQLIPCWAVFGDPSVANGLMYYGFINEWSVQYTHWTQFNVPMRCVISVNFTMLAMSTATGGPIGQVGVSVLPNGQPGPGGPGAGTAGR